MIRNSIFQNPQTLLFFWLPPEAEPPSPPVSKHVTALCRPQKSGGPICHPAFYRVAGCLLFIAFFLCQPVFSQKTRAQLEREKRQNMAKIAETNRILQETGAERQVSLGQLNVLTEQITTRKGLIAKMSEEVNLLNREMADLSQLLTAMEGDIADLQKEYAAMIYAAAKTTNSYNKMLFLFSAGSFTELLMRVKYLKQYSESRKEQLKQIESTRISLNQRRLALDVKKQQKSGLLASQMKESKNLVVLKDRQDRVVQKLTEKEKELAGELAERKESVDKLDKLIAAVVAEEVRRAAERERAKAAERERAADREAIASRGKPKTRTPTAVRAIPDAAGAESASSFSATRSRLAWPVGSGFISSHFGKQWHPIIKGAEIENHGVDIQTNRGEEVRAVYDGEVATITSIPGMNKLVIIRHGSDYMTVYAKLGKVSVETGQKIKARQVIGEVYTDREGTSELQFQIWRNSEKLNPETWLQDK